MRILFVLNRMAHVRHFDRAVRILADRGHEICLASQDDELALPGLLAKHPRITSMAAARNRGDDWTAAATMLRRTRDYIRYLHPRYASARLLRHRAFEKMVGSVSDRAETLGAEWSELLLRMPKPEQKRIDALLAKLETAIPCDPDIEAFVAAQRPDAIVLSPMVGVGFTQADFVKSARALGIPSGLLVFSWDNLSNKGLIHEMPDRMFVWNDIQVREAVKLHKYPADRVVVTGAPRFDEFFEMKPATTRAGILPVERPRRDPADHHVSVFVEIRGRQRADVRGPMDLGIAAEQRSRPGGLQPHRPSTPGRRKGMARFRCARPPVAAHRREGYGVQAVWG